LASTPEISVGSGTSTLLAFDTHTAAQAVAWRPDLADGHPEAQWAAITPSTDPGIAVPGEPDQIGLSLSLDEHRLGRVPVILDVEDATGLAYQFDLGELPSDGAVHSLLTAPGALGPHAAYPLRITGLSLSFTLPEVDSAIADLTVAALLERLPGAATPTPLPGARLASMTKWTATASSTLESYSDLLNCPVPPGSSVTDGLGGNTDGNGPAVSGEEPIEDGGSGMRMAFDSGAGLNMSAFCDPVPVTGTVILAASAQDPLPVLATTGYLHDNDLTVGSELQATVNGAQLNLTVAAAVTTFPGLPADGGDTLITDIGSLEAKVNALGGRLPSAYVWLMHTADGEAPTSLPPGASARTTKQVAADLLGDPLERVPRQIITLGAPILVGLALLGLLVSLLAAARGAAARDVVLAALGTTRPQRAMLACVLYAAVVTPAVVLGGLLGFALCRLLIPDFVLAADGSAPTPAASVLLAEPWSVLAAALVLLAAVATALVASLRRGDPLALARTGG
jgi:hypothetical protein